MKIARVFLLAALLVSAFPSTAFAPDETAGFIQLVSQPDPNTPMSAQTRQALRLLMPQILAAKAAGQIISFEPSPSSGILKILYRPSAGLRDLAGRTVYSQMQDAALPSAPGADRASGEALLCTGPGFRLYLYDNSFSANCLTAGARLNGSLRTPAGRVVAVSSSTADINGAIDNGYFSWSGPYADVIPGYTVTFKEYVGPALVGTFTIKAPMIKFTSINKALSIVQGTGPAGKPITLVWTHRKWDAAQTMIGQTRNRTISAAGTWSVDFGATPIRGSDYLHAEVAANARFTFAREMEVAHTYCMLGGYWCEITGFPLAPASLQIIHGGQTYNFSGKFDEWGYFDAELSTAGGAPIFLAAGDKVSGAGVAQYGLPNLTAGINYTTDVVSGKAPPNKYFYVWVYVASTSVGYYVYSHSNAAGSYAADFMTAYGLDLVASMPYSVEVYYVPPTTGNTTDMRRAYGP